MANIEPQDPASQNRNYVAAIPYAQNRFPDPPRLAIPPPHLDYISGEPVLGNLESQQAKSHDYGSSEYGNPDFLQALRSSCNMTFGHRMLSWEYNMRRSAQPILPFLLLGPSTVARDIDYVRNTGITMMISVRSAVSARASPKYMDASTFPSSADLSTLTIDLDSPYDLITRLPQTIKVMNDHLEKTCAKGSSGKVEDIKGKILVFCESGNERSTALVAAYLMILFGVDVVSAMQIIQSQRFCIAPEDGMKNMLTTFEDVLTAKRQVTMQNQGVTDINKKKAKRNVDTMYADEDEMMDDEFSSEDNGARRDWAPFQPK
jgi:serine/threonine/tyrosine-interacting protein